MGDLKTLSAAAKSYQKAMDGECFKSVQFITRINGISECLHAGMVSASSHFFSIFESIGAKASKLPGAVHKLGAY